jgi:hypothetical protein
MIYEQYIYLLLKIHPQPKKPQPKQRRRTDELTDLLLLLRSAGPCGPAGRRRTDGLPDLLLLLLRELRRTDYQSDRGFTANQAPHSKPPPTPNNKTTKSPPPPYSPRIVHNVWWWLTNPRSISIRTLNCALASVWGVFKRQEENCKSPTKFVCDCCVISRVRTTHDNRSSSGMQASSKTLLHKLKSW